MTDFDIALFCKAVGLAMFIEGVLWAGFPKTMREAAAFLGQQKDSFVRALGLMSLVLGLIIMWLAL